MRNDWSLTLDTFAMSWREPLTVEDVEDMEALAQLCFKGVRRRIERAGRPQEPDLIAPGDSLEKQVLSGVRPVTQ